MQRQSLGFIDRIVAITTDSSHPTGPAERYPGRKVSVRILAICRFDLADAVSPASASVMVAAFSAVAVAAASSADAFAVASSAAVAVASSAAFAAASSAAFAAASSAAFAASSADAFAASSASVRVASGGDGVVRASWLAAAGRFRMIVGGALVVLAVV